MPTENIILVKYSSKRFLEEGNICVLPLFLRTMTAAAQEQWEKNMTKQINVVAVSGEEKVK